MRRHLVIAAVVFALGPPALAARATEHGAKADKPAKPGTSVEMPILVAPMVVDGKLMAYAYVSSTVVTTSASAAIAVRAKTPFIQDAFIRDVNGKSIVQAQAPEKVDSEGLKARLLADVRRVVGADKVVAINFTALKVTPSAPPRGPSGGIFRPKRAAAAGSCDPCCGKLPPDKAFGMFRALLGRAGIGHAARAWILGEAARPAAGQLGSSVQLAMKEE